MSYINSQLFWTNILRLLLFGNSCPPPPSNTAFRSLQLVLTTATTVYNHIHYINSQLFWTASSGFCSLEFLSPCSFQRCIPKACNWFWQLQQLLSATSHQFPTLLNKRPQASALWNSCPSPPYNETFRSLQLISATATAVIISKYFTVNPSTSIPNPSEFASNPAVLVSSPCHPCRALLQYHFDGDEPWPGNAVPLIPMAVDNPSPKAPFWIPGDDCSTHRDFETWSSSGLLSQFLFFGMSRKKITKF